MKYKKKTHSETAAVRCEPRHPLIKNKFCLSYIKLLSFSIENKVFVELRFKIVELHNHCVLKLCNEPLRKRFYFWKSPSSWMRLVGMFKLNLMIFFVQVWLSVMKKNIMIRKKNKNKLLFEKKNSKHTKKFTPENCKISMTLS